MTGTTTKFTRVNHQWIKADSGHTYLCPVEELKKLDDPSEADLQAICVDESENPQNE